MDISHLSDEPEGLTILEMYYEEMYQAWLSVPSEHESP